LLFAFSNQLSFPQQIILIVFHQHTDRYASERILFIVSFIARPQLGIDHRQLARGTYFHMKWNTWGHTWKDIATHSAGSMAWPFNILRSLALWKPKTRNWGYDLLLSSSLRAANEQSGMEVEDLETFIDLKMNQLFHFPHWLQGTVNRSSPDAWKIFIQETLDNAYLFLLAANAIIVGLYLLLAIVATQTTNNIRFQSVLKRLLFTHALVALWTWTNLRGVQTSRWGANIVSGKTLMRPFPGENDLSTKRWLSDPSIPQGRTTLPERMDILFGSRYDAEYLGSYNQWLDFHPGNRILMEQISSKAYLYPMYAKRTAARQQKQQEDPFLLRALVQNVIDHVVENTNHGRFLAQDFLTGDWVIMSVEDAFEMVRLKLATEAGVIAKRINQQINFLVADYRFGVHRGTVLALESTIFLNAMLRKRMFGSIESALPEGKPQKTTLCRANMSEDKLPKKNRQQTAGLLLRQLSSKPVLRAPPKFRLVLEQPAALPQEKMTVGSSVMVYESLSALWRKGTVVKIKETKSTVRIQTSVSEGGKAFDIIYDDDGSFEENVTNRRLRKPAVLEEGVRVKAFVEDIHLLATVISVYPSGNVDLAFDDGYFMMDVTPDVFDIVYPTF
jgi:hypothetical protein